MGSISKKFHFPLNTLYQQCLILQVRIWWNNLYISLSMEIIKLNFILTHTQVGLSLLKFYPVKYIINIHIQALPLNTTENNAYSDPRQY
jgi:hypothetical protein